MKTSIIAIATLLAMGTALAGNNNGPVFGGTQNYNTTNNTTNQGGQGGQGGSAAAIAGAASSSVATGGNASAGVTSSIRNDVSSTNINANSNQQGQQQGQLQGQQQQAVSNSGGNKLTNEGNNAAQKTSVTVEGDTYQAAKIPVATAYAAPLAASNGTCMGSSSGGAQGPGFGVSFGSTWTDSSCDMRYDAEALRAAGLPGAAQARLCQKPEIASAMAAAGTPCPGAKKTAEATPAASPVASAVPAPAVKTSQYVGSDPIVMQRLGLAPLAK